MRSLGSRLTFWYALVVMLTVAATMVVGYLLLRRELIHGVDLLNAAEFREIRDRVETGHQPAPEADLLKRVAEHAEIDAPLYFFQVRNSQGEVLFRSPNMRNASFAPNAGGKTNRTSPNNALGLVRVGEFKEGGYRIQIAASLSGIENFSSDYLRVSLAVSGVALVLSIFLGHRLSRLALDPIRRIQQTAQRISADNLGARIPAGKGNDEVAALARLLNQMFDRLESSFDRLWRFAGDASHELKTPLSLIRLQSEKFLLHGQLSLSQQEIVQQQLEGIHRLNSVIERLLFLAKSTVGGIRPNAQQHDTAAFIAQFCEDAEVLCEDQGANFSVVRNESLAASFDGTLLRQVLLNLLTNALRVTPAEGCITLASWREGNRWMVRMEDPGPGLPASELERIFEPFARVIPPGERIAWDGDAGAGLGLTICRSVLEVHGGVIRAENRQPGPGLCVSFTLPAATASLDRVIPVLSLRGEEAGIAG